MSIGVSDRREDSKSSAMAEADTGSAPSTVAASVHKQIIAVAGM